VEDVAGRLFRLVDLLQARGRMTTAELAMQFGVSERTVRRDLLRLQELDVPVTATPGRHGGVSVAPGALLAPLRFTDTELLALLLGIRSLTPSRDAALASAAGSARKRLETVLTPRARARAEALDRALAAPPPVDADRAPTPADSERVLELAEAIHARRRVTLRYGSPDGRETVRDVDPYGLVRLGPWYVAAHCHLRADIRTFRVDRIRSLIPTGATFELPPGFDAFTVVAASIARAPAPGSIVCRVRIATDLDSASRRVPATAVVLEPDPGGVLLSVRAFPDELESIALHLLRLPWPLEVLDPPELREALREVGERALALSIGDAAR
jgi:predicted DNA-binding transcriptional regulator YafY